MPVRSAPNVAAPGEIATWPMMPVPVAWTTSDGVTGSSLVIVTVPDAGPWLVG